MDSKRLKIVIADDNDEQRKKLENELAVVDFLEICGTAKNGIDAVALIKQQMPDLVVLDVILAELDGFLVINKVQEFAPNCKFIILSSFAQDTFVSKAAKLGVLYYLLKPCKTEVLIERIKDSLNIEAPNDESNKSVIVSKQPHLKIAKRFDEKITNIFITVGIPAHIKGYQFLREAIKLAIDDPNIINSITKKLYPSIADRFETTSSKVERAIRHAIEVAWNRGKIENINSVFGLKVYSSNDKPTNGEFIALVADKMLLEG